ncbi:MAG: toxin-antitoxin system YwqK family antitoxin [Chitinivibrionales bacterium]
MNTVIFRLKKLFFILFLSCVFTQRLFSGDIFRGFITNDGMDFFKTEDEERRRTVVKGYYRNGKLRFTAEYKRGELDGKFREYYSDGTLKSEIPFEDSMREGMARFYYENGLMAAKIEYYKGCKTGKVRYYDESGILIASESQKDNIRREIRKSLREARRLRRKGEGEENEENEE